MNAIKTTLLALATAAALSGTAQAADLYSAKHYGDELARCIEQVRTDLNLAERPLKHMVTAIEKQGSWYNFTIETSAETANTPIATTNCEANRYSSETRIVMQPANLDADTTRLASAS